MFFGILIGVAATLALEVFAIAWFCLAINRVEEEHMKEARYEAMKEDHDDE